MPPFGRDTVPFITFKSRAPIFQRYRIPVFYNFQPSDMKWVRHIPRGRMLALDRVFPDGIFLPAYFFGQNIVHLPTVKCPIHTTTTRPTALSLAV